MNQHSASHRGVRILIPLCLVSIPLGLVLMLLFVPVARARAELNGEDLRGEAVNARGGALPNSTATVINTNNSGAGSLRDAIANAIPNDTIVFSLTLPATIPLSSTLVVNKSLVISGPGAQLLTISGVNLVRVIQVTSGVTVNLSGLSIADGNAIGDGGAGIHNSGILTVTASTIRDSSAGYGSGIYNGGRLNIISSTLHNNAATSYGGGLYNQITLTMISSIFFGNSASINGGGIRNLGALDVFSSTFHDNTAGNGGGIRNDNTLNITNTTFYSNSSTGGGAIDNTGTLTITNSTFSGNSAPTSNVGGIRRFSGAVTVRNTIFANNTLVNCTPSITDGGNNLRWPTSDLSCIGSYGDPKLAPLGYYGGDTQTMALLPGSAAIDAGNDANCPTADQRGFMRPIGSHCDIGAYESRGFTLTVSGGNNQSAYIFNPYTSPLSVTLSSGFGEPVNSGIVTFTVPSSGASATLGLITATIASSVASTTATANSIPGSFNVTGASNGANPVMFTLTNLARLLYLPLVFK